jgi:hypothetical protein
MHVVNRSNRLAGFWAVQRILAVLAAAVVVTGKIPAAA